MDWIRGICLVFACLVLAPVLGQINRYAVFFDHKENTPYQITQPDAFFSSRAIDRRVRMNISIDEKDLPVDPGYVEEVVLVGATVLYTSKWFNMVVVALDEGLFNDVLSLEFVTKVELAAPGPPVTIDSGGRYEIPDHGARMEVVENINELDLLGIGYMHGDGFRGRGLLVGVFDGGFPGVDALPAFAEIWGGDRISWSWNFVHQTDNVFVSSTHGTRVLSTLAADIPGVFLGALPEASYVLMLTEDIGSEYRIEEYNWVAAAEKADSAGVDIITTSLGYTTFDDPAMSYTPTDMDGSTAAVTIGAEMAFSRGIVVITSAGNTGNSAWEIVTAPADGLNVLAIGSVNEFRSLSTFSAGGPTPDGRIKPDVLAMGGPSHVVNQMGNVTLSSGTSFASPWVAGLAGGLVQAFPDYNAAEIVNLIKSSGDRADRPENFFGYGIPHYLAAVEEGRVGMENPEIYIYPNPVKDILKVRSQDPRVNEAAILQIFNSKGQPIASYDLNFSWHIPEISLDMTGFSQGIYLIHLVSNNYQVKFRFVKI